MANLRVQYLSYMLPAALAVTLLSACTSYPTLKGSDGEGKDGEKDGTEVTTSGFGGSGSNLDVPMGGASSTTESSTGDDTGGPTFDIDTLTIIYDGAKTIDVMVGDKVPSVSFLATVNDQPVTVGWSVDRGELATISKDGVLTPTGKIGGIITVRAGLNKKVVEYKIQIRIFAEQNGANKNQSTQVAASEAALTEGGGVAGVGGEGLGIAIPKGTLRELIGAGPTDDGSGKELEFLYPYDGTLFPRGMLAPLLMWRWNENDADAISIELSATSGNYSWTGTFGRPEILSTTNRPFIRHPIPQDVWDAATQSAGGALKNGASDTLNLTLTIAKDGVVYGPLSRSFAIAPGRLTGTVYYNSYGTQLVENYNKGDPKAFGAAVLGIHAGDASPTVVSGSSSDDHSGCRVCHTVSSRGSRLLVQGGGDDKKSWWNDLAGVESYISSLDGRLSWAGLSPDGDLALTNAVNLSSQNISVGSDMNNTRLFDMTQTPPVELTEAVGLPSDLKGALPNFSPDGTKVTFAYLGGTGAGFDGLATDGSQLIVMDFDRKTLTFSKPRVVATGTIQGTNGSMSHGAGFPSIGPNSSSLVFMNEVRGADSVNNANNETYIATREGARGELWWASTEKEQNARLDYANGRDSSGNSYLPKAVNYHGDGVDPFDNTNGPFDDTTLNYEPTVNPVTTGGYAWVVFTSRRMYGNLATQDPWLSDPRQYDFKDYDSLTTKKLWVAAINLGTDQDEDPSYPAFYLPGQELVAGNARGFWVLDPCHDEGDSCETGDQCCGGFCQPNGKDGALICSSKTVSNSCAGEQEKCKSAADCCDDSAQCIGGFCSHPAPPIIR